MDFSSIVTTLWSKISKPLPNILIGAVFLMLAPGDIKWVGFIFIAIGVSSIGEWLWHKGEKFLINIQRDGNIKNTLYALNRDEKELLRGMLERREQTYYINYHDHHYGTRGGGSRHEYTQLFGVCAGLKSKGLFVTASLDEITCWSFHPEVWQILQKELSRNPDFLKTGGG